ncbi:hypothetical protein YC2023_103431 [Brassica napus]
MSSKFHHQPVSPTSTNIHARLIKSLARSHSVLEDCSHVALQQKANQTSSCCGAMRDRFPPSLSTAFSIPILTRDFIKRTYKDQFPPFWRDHFHTFLHSRENSSINLLVRESLSTLSCTSIRSYTFSSFAYIGRRSDRLAVDQLRSPFEEASDNHSGFVDVEKLLKVCTLAASWAIVGTTSTKWSNVEWL